MMSAFNDAQCRLLARVLDLIVPPSPARGLPGASEVAVLEYLRGPAAEAVPQIQAEMALLEQASRQQHDRGFEDLNEAQRQALVDGLRARDPGFMARLALEAVTCYYQDPRVIKALGLEDRPPYPQGFQVIAGDLTLLAPVRKRGKFYRDA